MIDYEQKRGGREKERREKKKKKQERKGEGDSHILDYDKIA